MLTTFDGYFPTSISELEKGKIFVHKCCKNFNKADIGDPMK